MQAVVISEPGGPEKLVVREVATPRPSRGEVRVRVKATAVNRADLLQRMGLYPAPPGDPPDIPGLEYAGEVEAVGKGVTSLSVGDRVFGLVGGGAYAEFVVAHERTVVRMPENLTYREAAATPEAFITAYDALVTQGRMASGETVLIHAVGSGVGTAAVQLCRALGARSVGTARTPEKLERAKALGLDSGVPVADARFAPQIREATGGRGVDLVLELVGGPYLAEDLDATARRGRIVLVGLMAGAQANLGLAKILGKRLEIHGTVLRSRPLEEKIAAARTFQQHVVPLLAWGLVKPVIDRSFSLPDAAAAHEYVATNQGFGKVVLEG